MKKGDEYYFDALLDEAVLRHKRKVILKRAIFITTFILAIMGIAYYRSDNQSNQVVVEAENQ